MCCIMILRWLKQCIQYIANETYSMYIYIYIYQESLVYGYVNIIALKTEVIVYCKNIYDEIQISKCIITWTARKEIT